MAQESTSEADEAGAWSDPEDAGCQCLADPTSHKSTQSQLLTQEAGCEKSSRCELTRTLERGPATLVSMGGPPRRPPPPPPSPDAPLTAGQQGMESGRVSAPRELFPSGGLTSAQCSPLLSPRSAVLSPTRRVWAEAARGSGHSACLRDQRRGAAPELNDTPSMELSHSDSIAIPGDTSSSCVAPGSLLPPASAWDHARLPCIQQVCLASRLSPAIGRVPSRLPQRLGP